MKINKNRSLNKIYLFFFICGMFLAVSSTTNAVFATMDGNINNGDKIDGYYECEHPYIQELSHNITKDLKTPTRIEISKAIYNWMKINVVYEKPMYYNSKHYAIETAKLGKGNCCDQSRLFIALCRAAGIPRNATEFKYSNAIQFAGGNTYGHVWPSVTLENGTKIMCDTTSSRRCIYGHPSWNNKGIITKSYDLKI
jgi:transglutaminase-like putative cysteine protease